MKNIAVRILLLLGIGLLPLISGRTFGVFMATPESPSRSDGGFGYSAYADSAPVSHRGQARPIPRSSAYARDYRLAKEASWILGCTPTHTARVGSEPSIIDPNQCNCEYCRARRYARARAQFRRRGLRSVWRTINNIHSLMRKMTRSFEQGLTLQHIQQSSFQVERRIQREGRRARRTAQRLTELTQTGKHHDKEARIVRGNHIKSRLRLLELRKMSLILREAWEKIADKIMPVDKLIRKAVDDETMQIFDISAKMARKVASAEAVERKALRKELAKLQKFSKGLNWKSSVGQSDKVCSSSLAGKMKSVRSEMSAMKPDGAFYRHPWFSLTSPSDRNEAVKLLNDIDADSITWAHHVLEDTELAKLERIASDVKLAEYEQIERPSLRPRHLNTLSIFDTEAQRHGHYVFQVRDRTNSNTEESGNRQPYNDVFEEEDEENSADCEE